MGDIDENTPPIFVLLPTCDETNTDVFLEILKSVVLHTRFHDNFHINCIISAMLGETFQVDMDDLSVDWKKLTTNSRQIRQSKLLGFWAARHYPLIGKKLIGAAWQPPKECNVQISEPTAITKEEIDKIVSKKMKLRIIELNVCKGTSKKLNYFVRAPMSIGKNNVIILSSKMRAFEIESEYLEECWNALKLGGFSYDFEQQMDSTASFKAPQASIVRSHSHKVVRRNIGQSTTGNRNFESTRLSDAFSSSSRVSVTSPCNILLTDISAGGAKDIIASEPKTIPSAKRARSLTSNSSDTAIMHEETNIDELRLAICEMRKDIVNLTKCNAAENESQQFHLVVFKEKDSEIVKLKEFIQRLEKEYEVSKDERTKLSSEIVDKSNLITALQKVVDSNSKLHEKMEEESNAMVRKLYAADQANIELTVTKGKLQQELDAANIELKKVVDSNSDLHGMMESKATDRKLADMESHFQYQIQDLNNKLYAADQANIELTVTKGKHEQELYAANVELKKVVDSNSELHGMMQMESKATDRKLADMESHFQYQIQDLNNKLYAADQANIELTVTKGKHEQELYAANVELKKNEKLSETLHNLKTRTDILINEFRAQLEGTEEMNTQLAGENEKLQEELNILKQNSIEVKELLFLPDRPEMNIQTQREVKPVHDGYEHEQTVEGENIQCIGVVRDNLEETLPEPIERKSNEVLGIEPYGELQTDRDSNGIYQEPVKSSGCVMAEPTNSAQNGNKIFFWEKDFVSKDPIVEKCRPVLQRQKFGWMKFQSTKSAKFSPAFVYQMDEDGLERAQKIKASGCITNTKSPFWNFHFAWKLPGDMKQSAEVSALKKFNKRFGANFD